MLCVVHGLHSCQIKDFKDGYLNKKKKENVHA